MSVPIEFHLDNLKISDELKEKVLSHCDGWTDGHHDISNIYISVKQVSGKKSVHAYEAKVVIYHRPEHVIATHHAYAIPETLKGAIHSAERQLRESRKLYKDRRKRARSSTSLD